ncbi:MAG: thioredoxin family protein [Planctomycetes bacterium]|nr:thioredoxin family protein [Planctomycetota bacterium]
MSALMLALGLLPVVSADVGVDWRKDYDTARAEAREKGRLILLHFTLAGRPLCKTMDEETFADAGVARAARERFVSVRVDAEAKPELFEATIGGRGGLASCVVDAGGDVISALHGYAGSKAFLLFLERAEAGLAAVKSAREALARSPNDAALLHGLGEAYRSADSLRRAEECYRQALEQAKPGQEGAAAASHERLARLRVMRGKNLEARKHLEEARRLDPEGRTSAADRLLLTEGLTLAVERKHREAARVLEEALKRFPSSGEADHMTFALGFVLHQDGQDKPALEALEGAAKRFPESSWLPAIREQIEHIRNPRPDHTH